MILTQGPRSVTISPIETYKLSPTASGGVEGDAEHLIWGLLIPSPMTGDELRQFIGKRDRLADCVNAQALPEGIDRPQALRFQGDIPEYGIAAAGFEIGWHSRPLCELEEHP